MLKRTPLFAAHQKLGGKLIEFGGWEMPVQYSGIMDEHRCVRKAAGVFDISHMGEVVVSGPTAEPFLNQTLTNNLHKVAVGQGQYTLMCNERGGVIDDLYAYRVDQAEYLLIINASRIEADTAWLDQRWVSFVARDNVKVLNVSDNTAAIAAQGPMVAQFIDRCFPEKSIGGTEVSRVTDLKKNQIARFDSGVAPVWIARTGYTGEDGFEIIAPIESIEAIWNNLLAIGHPYCLQPCGLGARDTLRMEMCYPLYGQELDENTTPIEAGLGFFVALDKGDFVGRSALAKQKEKGVGRKCVAFRMTYKSAPPRPHYPVWSAGSDARKIGEVASGTQSPSLGVGIGIGYVPPEFAKAGTAVEIEIRGRRSPAVIVPKPIYKKPV